MSTISQIRSLVAQRVNEQFIDRLLDVAVKRHTAKGQRDCDCTFCAAKRRHTAIIGNYQTPPYIAPPYRWWDVYAADAYAVEMLREEKREQARTELEQLKKVVL